jgi:hypothetical protein
VRQDALAGAGDGEGIRLVAPDTIDEAGTVRSITPVSVVDVTQTQAHPARDVPC